MYNVVNKVIITILLQFLCHLISNVKQITNAVVSLMLILNIYGQGNCQPFEQFFSNSSVKTQEQCLTIDGTKYSRMDQVKYVEDIL